MDIVIVIELAIFVLLMALSGFFSSSETSLFSLNHLDLEQMRRTGKPRTRLIEELLSQPRQLIVTILIGNEFVNVAASVISAAIVIRLIGAENKWVNLVIMVPILLLFGEITPKTLAIRNNVAFASFQCRFIDLFARAITPLRWIVRHVSDFFVTLIVGRERSRANILSEDMVRSLAEEAAGDGALDRKEAVYINRIFDFGDTVLHDIMTPRSRMSWLRAGASLAEAAQQYHRTGHTKIPVYSESKDRVLGVLYARDLLAEDLGQAPQDGKPKVVSDLVREAYFVPETKPAADLFYTFRKRKLSLALTLDEYGGVTGLVTMEDVLECIFGEIMSPSELMRQHQMDVVKLGESHYRVEGTMTVWHLNRLLGAGLVSDAAETIGGLLFQAFGELPAVGSRVVLDSYEFCVEKIANQRIMRLTVRPAPVLGGPMESGMAGGAETSAVTSAAIEPASASE